MILKAIYRNIRIIKAHLIIFLLKSFIFFLSFIPIRYVMGQFFSGKTINENMFKNSDLNPFHEFFSASISPNMPWYGSMLYISVIIGGIVILLFTFFLIIDGFVDAGFLNAIEKGKPGSFFKGMKKYGFQFFKLRLFNVILFFIVASIVLLPTVYFYLKQGFNISIGVFLLLAIPSMFALKVFDHGKYLILLTPIKAGKAFIIALKSVLIHKKQTLILSIQTLLLFISGYLLYTFLDNSLIVNTIEKVWLMVVFHQFILFGKQILRYSYMAGVGNVIKLSKTKQVGATN